MQSEQMFAYGRDNRSMPAATVIPVLHYPDVPAAAAWLCRAFGFSERLRIGGHRIQLNVGQGAVVIAQGAVAPLAHAAHSVMIRVKNVDQQFEKAKQAGARIAQEPASFPFGERQCSVVDLAGHVWTFSQSEANVEPSVWGGQLVEPNDNAT